MFKMTPPKSLSKAPQNQQLLKHITPWAPQTFLQPHNIQQMLHQFAPAEEPDGDADERVETETSAVDEEQTDSFEWEKLEALFSPGHIMCTIR